MLDEACLCMYVICEMNPSGQSISCASCHHSLLGRSMVEAKVRPTGSKNMLCEMFVLDNGGMFVAACRVECQL